MSKLYAAALTIAVVASATYGGVRYGRVLERADNAEQVAALESSISALGLVIQKKEGEIADQARKHEITEGERVDAIKNISEKRAAKVVQLEESLRKEREKRRSEMPAEDHDDAQYRIVVVDDFVRVWDEARNSAGIPASESSSLLQKRLPAVTGADIIEAEKFLIGRYNQCASKYNQLWRACDRLITETTKKQAQ